MTLLIGDKYHPRNGRVGVSFGGNDIHILNILAGKQHIPVTVAIHVEWKLLLEVHDRDYQ